MTYKKILFKNHLTLHISTDDFLHLANNSKPVFDIAKSFKFVTFYMLYTGLVAAQHLH